MMAYTLHLSNYFCKRLVEAQFVRWWERATGTPIQGRKRSPKLLHAETEQVLAIMQRTRQLELMVGHQSGVRNYNEAPLLR